MEYRDENLHFYWIDGILVCDWFFIHADYNLVDFGVKKRIEISENKPCVMLSDIRSLETSTKEARQRMGEKDANWGIIAVAIIVNSRTQAIIYNFFHEIYKPRVPVKLFLSKKKAFEWCNQYVKLEDSMPETEKKIMQ